MKSSHSQVIKSTNSAMEIKTWQFSGLNSQPDHNSSKQEVSELNQVMDKSLPVNRHEKLTGGLSILGIQAILAKGEKKQKYGSVIRRGDDSNLSQSWEWSQLSPSLEDSQAGSIQAEPVQENNDVHEKFLEVIDNNGNFSVIERSLKEAQKKAEELLARTEADVDEIQQKAYVEGIELGKKEVIETLRTAQLVLNEAQNFRDKVLQDNEPTIIRMVQAIAKKMFSEGFILEVNVLKDVTGRAIGEANRLGNLRVYMHPEDVKTLLTLWQDADITINGQHIQLVSSQNILRGGCFIEGEFGSVDSRIETQMTTITDALSIALTNKRLEESES